MVLVRKNNIVILFLNSCKFYIEILYAFYYLKKGSVKIIVTQRRKNIEDG